MEDEYLDTYMEDSLSGRGPFDYDNEYFEASRRYCDCGEDEVADEEDGED